MKDWQTTQLNEKKQRVVSDLNRFADNVYEQGVRDGEIAERQRLLDELEKYKNDSVVAKLLLEKFEKE